MADLDRIIRINARTPHGGQPGEGGSTPGEGNYFYLRTNHRVTDRLGNPIAWRPRFNSLTSYFFFRDGTRLVDRFGNPIAWTPREYVETNYLITREGERLADRDGNPIEAR